MPQVYTTAPATVIALLGQAVARSPGGTLRQLAIGDRVSEGDVVITAQNGYIQLVADAAPPVTQAAPTREPLPVVVESDGGSLMPAMRVEALSEAIPAATTTVAGLAARPVAERLHGHQDRLAPEAEHMDLATTEDQALEISLVGRDPDGAVQRFLVVQVPTGGVMYRPGGQPFTDGAELSPGEAGRLLFVPARDFNGDPGPLHYRSIDTSGKASDLATVTIRIDAVNDAPVAGSVPLGPDDVAIADPSPHLVPGSANYAYQALAGIALSGQVRATDVDGDPLHFSAAAHPRHGLVRVDADGRFVYQPDPGYTGRDEFTVLVDDGQGGVATSTVFIDIADPAPVAAGSIPAWALGGEEVFAWQLAEPAAAGFGADDMATPGLLALAPMLDPRDLLQGFQEISFAALGPSSTLASPMDPVSHPPALDLAVDWGLRSSGLDQLVAEAALPID